MFMESAMERHIFCSFFFFQRGRVEESERIYRVGGNYGPSGRGHVKKRQLY